MIARIWKGVTRTEDAGAYERYMRDVALPGYREVGGNRGALMLRRDRADERTEFTMITLWDDMAAIRAFAGDEPERAVFYPDDAAYLGRTRPRGHPSRGVCRRVLTRPLFGAPSLPAASAAR